MNNSFDLISAYNANKERRQRRIKNNVLHKKEKRKIKFAKEKRYDEE